VRFVPFVVNPRQLRRAAPSGYRELSMSPLSLRVVLAVLVLTGTSGAVRV
jgi:hypothetical protein